MLYPLAIDGKNFGSLGNVFAQNVVANLSQGPIIKGLPTLEGVLAASVAKVNSHHNLGTQYINIAENGCTAESITYFHASLIGVGSSYGQVMLRLLVSKWSILNYLCVDCIRAGPVPRFVGQAVRWLEDLKQKFGVHGWS